MIQQVLLPGIVKAIELGTFDDICTFYRYMYIYLYQSIVELLSSHEKGRKFCLFITTQMDLEEIMVSEISQTEKDVFSVLYLLYRNSK